ncbi:MAG: AMP-binding protein [Actinobacteria bacterium]|nr:AMP-binding protein [Actinomycetota bacterium]
MRQQLWIGAVFVRSGFIPLLRPAVWLGFARAFREHGTHPTTGFALSAVRRPDGTALVDERGSLTWAQLEQRADALAVGLAAAADGQVTSIAILCRNHRGIVEALIASARLGADALLLNTGFSGPQLADVMEREQGSLIVYDEEFSSVLAETRGRVSGLVEVLAWTDGAAEGPTVERLIDSHRGASPPAVDRTGRVVLLTSGTTGTPKGARRSGGGPDELAGMLERIPWRAEETVVVAAPMFHAWGFGQLVIAAIMTCTVVMRRRFDPEATLGLVDDHRATGLSLVPVMLERIVELPEEVMGRYSLSTLRFVSASGSRMRPAAVTAFMDRFGDVVYNSYNATEAGQISVASPADLRHAPDTAGRPVPGTRVQVVDDGWHPVPVGEVGRIVVRGASPFEGYTHGGAKDARDGFMESGDVGRFDAEGRLYVVGRDDDMIVSGGENVYPIEVEKAIADLDAVREVVVIGVEDEDFGQRLAAYVVAVPGAALSPDDVRAHVKATLAGYKVPRDVVLLDELPRNAAGKVVARELRGAS